MFLVLALRKGHTHTHTQRKWRVWKEKRILWTQMQSLTQVILALVSFNVLLVDLFKIKIMWTATAADRCRQVANLVYSVHGPGCNHVHVLSLNAFWVYIFKWFFENLLGRGHSNRWSFKIKEMSNLAKSVWRICGIVVFIISNMTQAFHLSRLYSRLEKRRRRIRTVY